MKTAGKRIASFGLVMIMVIICIWPTSLAGWLETQGLSAGYSGQIAVGISLGQSSQEEDLHEESAGTEGKDTTSLGKSESNTKLSAAQLPVAAPLDMLRAGSVNVMKDITIRSIETPSRSDWFYVNETVSVRIDLEHNGAIKQGATTQIQLPDKLTVVKTSDTIAIPNEEDNNRIIGIATIDTASNSVYITATDGVEKANKVTGYLVLSAEINRVAFQNPNFDDEVDEIFEFIENSENSISLTKTIKARQVTASYHLFYKSGKHIENGRIQWNTNINYYGSPETRWNLKGIRVADTIGEDHELVPGSVQVTAYTWITMGSNQLLYHGSPYEITEQCKITVQADGRGFTVEIPDTPNLPSNFNGVMPYPYRITYKTDIKDNFSRTKYENTATLTATNNGNAVSRNSSNWVVVEAGAGGTIATAKLTIEKIDAETGEKLANAIFDLRNDKDVTLATLVTDADGAAFYEGPLVANKTYYLHETHTPGAQYELAEPIEVMVTQGNTEVHKIIKNQRAEQLGILEIRKLDKEGFRLSDATFILFKDEDMTLQVADQLGNTSWTTGSDGQPGLVRIEGIPIGTYYLLEIQAPQGYKKDITPKKVEVLDNPSGVSAVVLYNERDEFTLTVLKEDANTKKLLSGAEFTAYRKGPSGNWVEVDSFTITDPNQGYTRQVIVGEYRLWENKAPEGYRLPNKYIEFTITEADKLYGTYTIIVSNEKQDANSENASVRAYTHEESNEEIAISGAELVLFWHDGIAWKQVSDVTTGNTGLSGVIGGLSYGTYKFAPENDPEGYTAAIDEKAFELTMQNSTRQPMIVPVPYVPELATLEIIKYDMDDGSYLPGAKFSLQATDGTDYFISRTTGTDGKIVVDNIPYGTYILWEVSAPSNYYTSGYSEEIIIDEAYEIVRVSNKLADPDASANVLLIKHAQGDDTVRLSDAEFELERLSGNSWELYLHGLKTDEGGRIYIHNLPDGVYRFVETVAPSGYKIDVENNSTVFYINESSEEVVTISVANQKKSSIINSRERDKGSDIRDVYRHINDVDLPSSDFLTADVASAEASDGERPWYMLEGASNPWTGMYLSPLFSKLLILAASSIVIGGILILGFGKEE